VVFPTDERRIASIGVSNMRLQAHSNPVCGRVAGNANEYHADCCG
jgi:hypothetical protein